jgi:hypothetical protein
LKRGDAGKAHPVIHMVGGPVAFYKPTYGRQICLGGGVGDLASTERHGPLLSPYDGSPLAPIAPEKDVARVDVPRLWCRTYDVLRDGITAYEEKLKAAGIPVTNLHAADMGLNFPATPNLVSRFSQCNETSTEIANWLKSTFATETKPSLEDYIQGLQARPRQPYSMSLNSLIKGIGQALSSPSSSSLNLPGILA